jgi:hypothetical protein
MTQTQPAPGPGAYFDVPGIGGGTQWTDQDESTVTLNTALAQGVQTVVNGILPFKATDVVVDWQIQLNIAQTYTDGAGAASTSPYAPWNNIGPVKLLVQNQYASVDVENGIDLYIFNLLRPWRESFIRSNIYASPAGDPLGGTATGYQALGNAQAPLLSTAQWTKAAAAWQTILRLPASITFDLYWDLDVYGRPVGTPPHAAIVSPQYMAGATRQIIPQVTFQPGIGVLDQSPIFYIGGAPTYTVASAVSTFRRKAIYSSDPTMLPPVYAWQYRWRTARFSIAGVSTTKLLVPQDTGQLLAVYIRMWDPSSAAIAAGAGAPIQLSAVSRIQVQYGSGLFAFDGTAAQLQADWLEKHDTLLPPGVFCLDLMLDERNNRTNKRALNTLTTAGILVSITFTGAQSATAYAVMGLESLVYVA